MKLKRRWFSFSLGHLELSKSWNVFNFTHFLPSHLGLTCYPLMIPRAENKKKIFSPRKAEKLFILYLHCRWLLLSWTEQSGLGECYDWGWPWPLGSWLSLPPSSWPRWHSTPRHPAPHLKMTITVRVWNGYLDLQKISFRINWNKGSMYIAKLCRSKSG